jgi:hypothetical protein
MRAIIGAFAGAIVLVLPLPAAAGALRFVENPPLEYDFVDIPRLPPAFGRGEFAFELWIKPDEGLPVGETFPASLAQLSHWSSYDPEPYSSDGWWIRGNFLLDGHTRPEGFFAGDSREGTFSLQFYGGGRLRLMFADRKEGAPRGMVYAAQAWPASSTPSLLDGKWHHVVAQRRWREPAGAMLELWVDGALIGSAELPERTDMRRFWDNPAHPNDPEALGGWSLGAEVMTAWNYAFTQFEDYKGLVDDIRIWGRALTPAEVGRLAAGRLPQRGERGLLAHFGFEEGGGAVARDSLDPSYQLVLVRPTPSTWSDEDAPKTPR